MRIRVGARFGVRVRAQGWGWRVWRVWRVGVRVRMKERVRGER